MVLKMGFKFISLTGLNLHFWLLCTLIMSVFMSTSEAQTPVKNDTAADFTPASNNQRDAPSQSNSTIKSLLQQFVKNGSSQIFDGTFVYFFEDKIQTVKVHRDINEQGKVVEEFVPLDSKQNKSTRVLENQYCLLNNDWQYQFQAMSSSFPFRVNNFYEQLQRHYDFKLSDIVTVAGTPAIGLYIKNKDPYRYGYQLWFEPRTATLLKYKLVGQKDNVIEQYLFTDIKIHNDPELENNSTLLKESNLSQLDSCSHQFEGMTKAFEQYFFIKKIPEGYEPVSYRKGYINDSERQAFQFQLSDGLSTVSIFIEDSKKSSKKINGVVKLGPVNVAGKTIGKYQVTVIGAIPIVSALHFIDAVKLFEDEYSSLNQTKNNQ